MLMLMATMMMATMMVTIMATMIMMMMRQFLTRTLLLLALLSSAPSRRVVVGTPYELVSILHFMRKIKDTNCQYYYPRSILTHLAKSTQRCRNYWGIREYPTHWRIIDIYKQPCTIYHTWKKASRSGVYREKNNIYWSCEYSISFCKSANNKMSSNSSLHHI